MLCILDQYKGLILVIIRYEEEQRIIVFFYYFVVKFDELEVKLNGIVMKMIYC